MANCSKCGNPIKQGEKFCASCGTPVKQATAIKTTAKKSAPAKAVEGAAMGKIAKITVTAACGVTVIFFFLSFFSVSFAGSGVSVNGMQAAVSSDNRAGSANPALLLVWFLAIALLVALYVPIIREKLQSIQLPAINIPVIGGLNIYAYLAIIIALIGLIVLIAAYSSTIGYLKREFAGYDAYLAILGSSRIFRIGTGIGFKMVVFAHLVLLGIPFADKYFLSKRG
jgi:hypothetical protein